MISVEEAAEVAQAHGLPLIIDAAEEDIQKYVKYGDLAIYSGSKAIEGPTSGIVGGKRQYVEWVKAHMVLMKVGKETTFGLLQALDEYMVKEDKSEQEKAALEEMKSLSKLPGIEVSIVQDEAGRAIYRGA